MTKPEQQDSVDCTVQRTFLDALLEAKHRGKVTCGLYETAELLEDNPYLSGICVLPKSELRDDCDGLLFMMETFCRENGIPIIKVTDLRKLADEIGLKTHESYIGEELNCILIETRPPLRQSKKVNALLKKCGEYEKEGRQILLDIE